MTPAAQTVRDFRGELDAARALPDRGSRVRGAEPILRSWIEREPDSALAYVRSLRLANEFPQGMLVVLSAVSERDPDRALAFAVELALSREKRSFYRSLFERLGREDGAAAAARIARLPPDEDRAFATRALVETWAQRDFAAASAWSQLQPEPDRSVALEVSLRQLALHDPLNALELAQKNLTGAARERVAVAALEKFSAADPEAAVGLVELLPPGEGQLQARISLAREFGAKNPAAAIDWVRTLPENLQQSPLNAVLRGWIKNDPSAAAEFVTMMAPGAAQNSTAIFFAEQFGAIDPTAAIAWARGFPVRETSSTALSHIASVWARREPAAAVSWVLAQTDLPSDALHGAFFQWRRAQPAAAESWLETTNFPLERKNALRGPPPAGLAGLP